MMEAPQSFGNYTSWRTTEMRWFFHGAVTPEARAWFAEAWPEATREEQRVDVYLALATDDLSIKIRGAWLEAKGRLRVLGERRFGPAAGHLEHWSKWSVPAPASVDRFEPGPGALGRGFAAVRKERVLAGIAPGGSVHAAAEITSVEIAGHAFWTVSVEAGGDGAASESAVRAAVLHLAASAPPVPLVADASYGYAAFLRSVAPE